MSKCKYNIGDEVYVDWGGMEYYGKVKETYPMDSSHVIRIDVPYIGVFDVMEKDVKKV